MYHNHMTDYSLYDAKPKRSSLLNIIAVHQEKKFTLALDRWQNIIYPVVKRNIDETT